MTLKQYYAAYKGVLGILSALVVASPLVALVIPIQGADYLFPPLGSIDIPARAITIAAVLLTTYVIYFLRKNERRAIGFAAAMFVVSAVVYTLTFFRVVRTIPIPSKSDSVTVSIGFHRTEFANQNFPDETDEQILRYRGFSEEEIRHCWTMASLLLARGLLWVACTASLSFLVACFGFGIIATKGGGMAEDEVGSPDGARTPISN